jgi:hypothetical protein
VRTRVALLHPEEQPGAWRKRVATWVSGAGVLRWVRGTDRLEVLQQPRPWPGRVRLLGLVTCLVLSVLGNVWLGLRLGGQTRAVFHTLSAQETRGNVRLAFADDVREQVGPSFSSAWGLPWSRAPPCRASTRCWCHCPRCGGVAAVRGRRIRRMPYACSLPSYGPIRMCGSLSPSSDRMGTCTGLNHPHREAVMRHPWCIAIRWCAVAWTLCMVISCARMLQQPPTPAGDDPDRQVIVTLAAASTFHRI